MKNAEEAKLDTIQHQKFNYCEMIRMIESEIANAVKGGYESFDFEYPEFHVTDIMRDDAVSLLMSFGYSAKAYFEDDIESGLTISWF